ncbi:phosphomannomutase [Psychrobacter sp. SWN149]|uniref:phosphomannomutase n=1 Tax=Psychrobacter sp. SWN149 TaxID=2792057 RepID=UPI0018CCE8D3|nr:phosphomannomutase [Psychrobacter sp. SWN149]MBH0005609.1 phosphomannomutase [Psychrobacter sp. SWN149]
MPSFAAQQSLFRAYDIRGYYQHFTDEFIQALGHAFGRLYHSHSDEKAPVFNTVINTHTNISKENPQNVVTVVVGYDVRCGSEAIARTLSAILVGHNIRVIQLGLVTTPMVAFWAARYHGHGITVTASHSAKDTLGIKWLVSNTSPSSAAIQALYQQLTVNHDYHFYQKIQAKNRVFDSEMVENNNDTKPSSYLLDELSTEQVESVYIDAIERVFNQLSEDHCSTTIYHPKNARKLDLIVVIDCLNGAAGSVAQHLFDHFCQHVIMLNDTPDGCFPLGNPDPTEPNRLKQLQRAVIAHHADIGLAFDGDGDRLMVVDNNGRVVMPDHLLYLLARIAITERPESLNDSLVASEVLFDIKCAHHLPRLLSHLGATPVISKTGSSFMRQQIRLPDSQIVFAGELSGHFIFNDHRFIPYDDAMYAALRLLHWFALSGDDIDNTGNFSSKKSLSDIIQSLPAMVSTADHYLPMPPSATTDCAIMEQLTKFCRYLQQLIPVPARHHSLDNASHSSTFIQLPTMQCPSSVCTCASVKSSTTLAQAKHLLPIGTSLSCIDGVRLDFPHGFGVLRQSNTSNSLTARFAGDSIDDLKDIQAIFATLCRPFNTVLAEQILAMVAE